MSLTSTFLIKHLKDYPIEIVNKLIEEFTIQGHSNKISLFQNLPPKLAMSEMINKGFDWEKTNDGLFFWINVIVLKNFDSFFEKYPKTDDNSKYVYIWQDGSIPGDDIIHLLEYYGGYNTQHLSGRGSYGCNKDYPNLYYIDPDTKIINVVPSMSVHMINLIKHFYKEVKVANKPDEIRISKKEAIKILSEKLNMNINDITD